MCLMGWQVPSAYPQLSVVEGAAMNMTPEQLIENYLIGEGVTISNATFNGSSAIITSNQIGTFATAGAASLQLGLSGGILMTSGKASIAIGPNNNGGAGANTGGGGDPDLNIISGTSTFDKAVLEFDFIPEFDSIQFQYVFGSEEFFEYCNQFNDAFGFFLSGPGINGTFSNNAINIALMPGSSSMYVTINNICANTLSRWDNTGGIYYQYDALTHVFTATAVVQPCSTYHIKLAIADAIDHVYDSGVFLEENSFSAVGVSMTPGNGNPAIGNVAIEGCNDVTLSFVLSTPQATTFTLNCLIGGTATNGVDYTFIPSQVVFPPMTDSVTMVVHPLLDWDPEGEETIIITIDQITCDGSVMSDTIPVLDYIPMEIQPGSDTTVCHGAEISLMALVTDGLPPYTYQWNAPGGNDSVLTIIPPVGNNIYTVKVTDVCTNAVHDTVIVLTHPTPVADAGPDQTIPNGTSTILSGSASTGIGPYTWLWSSNPPGFSSTQQNPGTGNLYFTTIFELLVTDTYSGCISGKDPTIVIVEGGPLSVNPVADPGSVCFGSSTQLFALAGGGSGMYTYSWTSTPSGFFSSEANPIVSLNTATTFHLTVNDGFNLVSGNVPVSVYPLPVIHLGPSDTTVCIYDTLLLDAGNPGSEYSWSNGDHSQSILISSTGIGFDVQSYTVTVTNANGCVDSASITVIFSFGACTGVVESADAMGCFVFPNPSQGVFRVAGLPPNENVEITLISLCGTKIADWTVRTGKLSTLPQEFRADYLPGGIYFLFLKSKTFSGVCKVIIR